MEKTRLEEQNLADYASQAQILGGLRLRVAELEDTVAALDENIEEADRIGLDEVVDIICKQRNQINLDRIELELQCNKIEKQLLEFEKISLMTR
jgi:hypothetical protein